MIIRNQCVKPKHVSAFLLTVLIFVAVLLPFISSIHVFAANTKSYVDDGAGLLASSEEEKLNTLLSEYSKKHNIDIVVITRNGLDNKTDQRYLEDYVDEVVDAGIYSEDITALMFDTYGRYCTIQAYGESEYIIDDDNIEYLLDAVVPQITANQFLSAFSDFAKGVDHYYDNPRYEFGHEPIYLKTWFQAVVALAIGGIVVGSMAYNSQGRNTVNNHTYLDEKHSGLVASRDIYLRTSVSKVRKPSNNNAGGGRSSGGGGISSGGRSHSGGSRKC